MTTRYFHALAVLPSRTLVGLALTRIARTYGEKDWSRCLAEAQLDGELTAVEAFAASMQCARRLNKLPLP
jgi:hypothetical protein